MGGFGVRNAGFQVGMVVGGIDPQGIDLVSKLGAPIYAVRSVSSFTVEAATIYGNLVILQHKDKYVTVYAHNRRNLVDEAQRWGRVNKLQAWKYGAKHGATSPFRNPVPR